MIYIKNTTEIQTIFIPRNELQKEAYITSTKTYEDGYREGLEDGKEYQKDQLLNLYVTENGQYEREDGWGVVTVDIPIGDCPECEDCSGAYDEGYNQGYEDGQNSVECPEGGSCNLGEGEIYLTASDAGFYELYAAEDGYDGWSKFYVTLEGVGAIKVHKASDLLDTFNNGEQIDFGAYYYVGGKITEIEEISMQYGNATYILDNGFKIYRGDWLDGSNFYDENQIKVGAYIVVYGIIQDYRGQLQLKAHSQVIAYQECEGGEIVSCNIQDYKWVKPSMADRAENGDIYIYPDEGFDAVGLIDFDPSNIYNEGYNDAKAEGILLEDKWMTPSMEDRDGNGYVIAYPSEGFDGLSRVVFDPTTIYNEGYTDGYNEGSNQLSNNVLEGDMVLSFQLNDNNFPNLRNDGQGIFMWDGFKVPLYIKRPNGCGEIYLSGDYDNHIVPSLQSKFFQDSDYAKIEKLTINLWHILPNNIVNVVNLKELHLTERVEIIDKNAFQDVSNLKTIYCYYDGGAYMSVTNDSFVGLPNNGTLYVKKSQQPSWMWIRDLGWTIVNI